jgi:hypothetical protein
MAKQSQRIFDEIIQTASDKRPLDIINSLKLSYFRLRPLGCGARIVQRATQALILGSKWC